MSGNPAAWLVTGLDANTPVLSALSEIRDPLRIEEQGSLYRSDGAGFLFGPVGTPVAYAYAQVAVSGPERMFSTSPVRSRNQTDI